MRSCWNRTKELLHVCILLIVCALGFYWMCIVSITHIFRPKLLQSRFRQYSPFCSGAYTTVHWNLIPSLAKYSSNSFPIYNLWRNQIWFFCFYAKNILHLFNEFCYRCGNFVPFLQKKVLRITRENIIECNKIFCSITYFDMNIGPYKSVVMQSKTTLTGVASFGNGFLEIFPFRQYASHT